MLIAKLPPTGTATDRASVYTPLRNFVPPFLLRGCPHFHPSTIDAFER